jgi:trimeric autotransporter adhesin
MKTVMLFLFILLLFTLNVYAQTTVFFDDILTNQSASWTTSGQIGASILTVTRSADDWGARRNTNGILELTNDVSEIGQLAGWVYVYVPTGAYTPPYSQILALNPGIVTWTFNMRQIMGDPSGFGLGSYGVAFILGSTSEYINSAGTQGYAVVLGQPGNVDPIRLVEYNNGIQGTMTNIITSNTTGLADFSTHYVSCKVTYDPSTNTWELFLRSDGGTAFADPASGTLTSQGTAINNTYTSTTLSYLGCYWQGSNAALHTAFFDNLKVTTMGGLASPPTTQAVSLELSNLGSTIFEGSFTAASCSPDGYLVVLGAGSIPTGTPIAGKAYTASDTLGVDGIVVYSGSLTTFTASGLSPGTTYYIRVYSFNGSGTSTNYLTTNPLEGYLTTTAMSIPVVTMNKLSNGILLHWGTVTGVSGYKVYSSDNPYGGYSLLTTVIDIYYLVQNSDLTNRKFYKVTAVYP